MSDDVVPEMDAWLAEGRIGGGTRHMVQRARDRLKAQDQEIAALREANRQASDMIEAWEDKARAKGLEEAAQLVEAQQGDAVPMLADAIRALKDKP